MIYNPLKSPGVCIYEEGTGYLCTKIHDLQPSREPGTLVPIANCFLTSNNIQMYVDSGMFCPADPDDYTPIYMYPLPNTAPVITILGDNPAIINHSSIYVDQGATARDQEDGDITADIITSNPVDTSILGTYEVKYTVQDSNDLVTSVIRDVQVIDIQPPVITLIGGDEVITTDQTYIDQGATAVDDFEGDITSDIIIVNSVDDNTIGLYTVTYDVQDSSGNEADQVVRNVTVNQGPYGLDDTLAGYMYFIDVGLQNVVYTGWTPPEGDSFIGDPRQYFFGQQSTSTLTYGNTVFENNIHVWGSGVGGVMTSYHSKMCWSGDDSEFRAWLFTSDDGTPTHASTKLLIDIEYTAVGSYYNNTFVVNEYDPVTQIPTAIRNEANWYFGTYAGRASGNFTFNTNSLDYSTSDIYGLPAHTTALNNPLPDRFFMVIYSRAYGTYTQSCTAQSRMRIDNSNLI